MHIGILFIATGRYIDLFAQVYASFERYFLLAHKKTYFLFTDSKAPLPSKVQRVPVQHKKWPAMTLYRYHFFLSIAENIRAQKIEVLYFCDVDMQVVAKVDDKVLPTHAHPLVASAFHPKNTPGLAASYVRDLRSVAYVPNYEAHYQQHSYIQGGFQGGATEAYLTAAEEMKQHIEADEKKGVVAHRHDQSHWNRYYIDHPALFKVLGDEYCYYPHTFSPHSAPRIAILLKDIEYYRYGSVSGLGLRLLQKIKTAFRLLWRAEFRLLLQKGKAAPRAFASIFNAIGQNFKRP